MKRSTNPLTTPGSVRRRTGARRVGVAAGALVGALALSSCGLGTSAGMVDSADLGPKLSTVKNLDGAKVAVGSKQFTEQQVLGKMAVILLKAAGANVQDFTTIPGSAAAREAMLQKQVTFMWDYTGTAWISYMGHTKPIADSNGQYEAVRKEDAANGISWLKPSPANDTYTFAMRQDTAKRLGVTSLADIAKVPMKDRTLCVDGEFANREDGLEPMLKAYGVPLGSGVPRNQVKKLDQGAIYAAVDHKVCTFGEAFTTDGRIDSLHLLALSDPKNFFPKYNISAVVTSSVLKKNPSIEQLFAPVAARLNNDTMMKLNAKVDVNGEDPADVAREWLKQEQFIK